MCVCCRPTHLFLLRLNPLYPYRFADCLILSQVALDAFLPLPPSRSSLPLPQSVPSVAVTRASSTSIEKLNNERGKERAKAEEGKQYRESTRETRRPNRWQIKTTRPGVQRRAWEGERFSQAIDELVVLKSVMSSSPFWPSATAGPLDALSSGSSDADGSSAMLAA